MQSLVTVIETGLYLRKAEKLLSEEEREAVKTLLATNPEQGILIPETGGVRKARIPMQGRGKSGGGRVIYYYRNDTMPLHLLALFAKNEKANISKEERNMLAQWVRSIDAERTKGK